jgi:hypothetical protein
MKKIIFFLGIIALLNANANSQVNRKPLHSYTFKITLQSGDSIVTRDNVLRPKTYPTAWYFGTIDTSNVMYNGKVNIDQTVMFQCTFQLYADYYQYWNYYNPFQLKVTSFRTGWVDVLGGWDFENAFPEQMIEGLAASFNLPINRFSIQQYYN